MRELIEEFLTYYLTERDMEKVLSMFTENVIGVGTSEREIGKGKAAMTALLLEEKQQGSEPILFRLLDYSEQELTSDVFMYYAKIWFAARSEAGEKQEYEGRLTGSLCRQEGQWKISSLHMSMPATAQEEEEYLPLQSVYGKAEAQAKRNAVELMKDVLPGGIIGGYLEPGLPLYIINDEMIKLLGFDSYEEVMSFSGGLVKNLIYSDDRERIDQQIREILKQSKEYDVTYRQLKKDGRFLWVRDKGRMIATENGRKAIVSVVVDVSDMEKATASAEEHLDAIMRMNPTAMSTYRINLTKDTLTHAVSKYNNLQKLQEKGSFSGYVQDALQFFPLEKERLQFVETFNVQRLLNEFQQGHMKVAMSHRYIPDGDQEYILQTIVSMVLNPVTREIEGVVYTLDTTQETYNQRINELLVNNAHVGITAVNIRKSTFFIPQFTSILDFPTTFNEQDYQVGLQQVVDRYVIEEEKEHYLECGGLDNIVAHLEKDGKYSFNSIWEKEGKRLNMRMSCYYLDDTHEQFIGIAEDITDAAQKDYEYEQKMKTALKAAEDANRAKSDFLSSMSHDIRTPLNAILNLTKLMDDELDDKKALKADIEKIEVAGEFLRQLINDILDISKIESGKAKLEPRVYTYASFLNYVRGIIRPLCDDKDINFVLEEGPTAFDIYMDRAKFHQLFFNILSNAVKYTPPGGTVTFETCNNVVHDGILTCDFVVTDTGCGMSKEAIEHAFDPFVRGNNTEAYIGSGLGLAICKRILDLMGGTIAIESEVGKGTRVTVHMDLQIATEEQRRESQAEMNTNYDRKQIIVQEENCRILIAEDNDINAEILIRLLEKDHLKVERVCNGQEAVEAVRRNESDYYQMILMDVRMPVMDGLEATRLIRKEPNKEKSSIPIIAITANAFESDRQECLDSGMNGCLAKPIIPQKLKEMIATYIQMQHPEE